MPISPLSSEHLRQAAIAQGREAVLRAKAPIQGWGMVSRYRAQRHWQSVRRRHLDAVVREELRVWSDRGLAGLASDCTEHGYHPTLPADLAPVAAYLRERGLPATVVPA